MEHSYILGGALVLTGPVAVSSQSVVLRYRLQIRCCPQSAAPRFIHRAVIIDPLLINGERLAQSDSLQILFPTFTTHCEPPLFSSVIVIVSIGEKEWTRVWLLRCLIAHGGRLTYKTQ